MADLGAEFPRPTPTGDGPRSVGGHDHAHRGEGEGSRSPQLAGTRRVAHVPRAARGRRRPSRRPSIPSNSRRRRSRRSRAKSMRALSLEGHDAGVHRTPRIIGPPRRGRTGLPLRGNHPSSVTATMSSERYPGRLPRPRSPVRTPPTIPGTMTSDSSNASPRSVPIKGISALSVPTSVAQVEVLDPRLDAVVGGDGGPPQLQRGHARLQDVEGGVHHRPPSAELAGLGARTATGPSWSARSGP